MGFDFCLLENGASETVVAIESCDEEYDISEKIDDVLADAIYFQDKEDDILIEIKIIPIFNSIKSIKNNFSLD